MRATRVGTGYLIERAEVERVLREGLGRGAA